MLVREKHRSFTVRGFICASLLSLTEEAEGWGLCLHCREVFGEQWQRKVRKCCCRGAGVGRVRKEGRQAQGIQDLRSHRVLGLFLGRGKPLKNIKNIKESHGIEQPQEGGQHL